MNSKIRRFEAEQFLFTVFKFAMLAAALLFLLGLLIQVDGSPSLQWMAAPLATVGVATSSYSLMSLMRLHHDLQLAKNLLRRQRLPKVRRFLNSLLLGLSAGIAPLVAALLSSAVSAVCWSLSWRILFSPETGLQG